MTVYCRLCKNCTGCSCKVYGDNPEIATSNCARDNFKNYKPYKCVECENFTVFPPKEYNKGKCKYRYYPHTSAKQVACLKRFKKRGD